MKRKRTITTALILALSPFCFKLGADVFKSGIKDGKAHASQNKVKSETKKAVI
ncbi:hypothetical protein [Pedobacter metabolipauper]|uniref:Uncharacterized protein n=1 Tax=Pedobacter metabolipauper TaxID=425513 RepID=A0A4R6T0K3_9SPHI|nr:hypothetical protein [Pedobacter metabolipauper]TDQ11895.1 hypothetical protein ATK78_1025 [Pedobacter metabolipauper]